MRQSHVSRDHTAQRSPLRRLLSVRIRHGVLILGAGGHGKVVADILQCQGIRVRGFLDDDPALWGTRQSGLSVFGPIDTYTQHGPGDLIVGVGSIAVRQEIVRRLGWRAHARWCNAIHPRAIIAASARLGPGTMVAAGAVVNSDVVLGEHVIVNTGATVDHDCVIGDFAHIAPGVHLAGGVRIGRETLIGIGVTVIPQRCVGDVTVVGAGSVVIEDIPDGVTAAGVPARISTLALSRPCQGTSTA